MPQNAWKFLSLLSIKGNGGCGGGGGGTRNASPPRPNFFTFTPFWGKMAPLVLAPPSRKSWIRH